MLKQRVVALLIGKRESKGFPGKNILPILGRPLCEYPLIAATKSEYISKVYVSTDCPEIASTAAKYSAILIERPPEILDPETLTLAEACQLARRIKDQRDLVHQMSARRSWKHVRRLIRLNGKHREKLLELTRQAGLDTGVLIFK